MNKHLLQSLGTLMLGSLIFFAACKNQQKEGQKTNDQITAVTTDSVFDTELQRNVPDDPDKNKFFIMQFSKGVLDTLVNNGQFEYIYFAMENDDAQKPRKTTLVAYAMTAQQDYLYKDAQGNPIPLPLEEAKKIPVYLKQGQKVSWSQFFFSKASIQARIDSVSGNYAFMLFTPKMNSPVSYDVSLTDGSGARVGSSCSLQPSPPAKPGDGSCL